MKPLVTIPSFELPDVIEADNPEHMDYLVSLDGRRIHGCYQASPRRGWCDVREYVGGDNFNEQGVPKIVNDDYVNKRLYGVVTVEREIE